MSDLSMREANEIIESIGLPPIDKTVKSKLTEYEAKETIQKAIRRAQNDQNAQTFLRRLFARAGVVAQQTVAQPTPHPVPENSDQSPAPAPKPKPIQNNESPVTPAQTGKASDSPDTRDRLSYHVYGGKAALCFEADMKRTGDAATVAIDAAMASGERQYDWQSKIRIQITQSELPVVAGVFLGIRPGCQYGQHGQEKNKGFVIQRQDGGKVYMKVMAKDEPMRAVPIEAPDVFRINALFMRQILKNHPWLDATGAINLIRASIKDYEGANPRS